MAINKLHCFDKDRFPRIFVYKCVKVTSLHGDEWTYQVRPEDPNVDDSFFELRLVETLPGVARVDMVNNFGAARFTAKGIPDALLPVVKSELGMQIVSSPRVGPGSVYRTDAATKMWERLVAKNLAAYDQPTDVFSLCWVASKALLPLNKSIADVSFGVYGTSPIDTMRAVVNDHRRAGKT